MKPSLRSRKVVLDSIKGPDDRNLETPSRLPANRFVLRVPKKEQNPMSKKETTPDIEQARDENRQQKFANSSISLTKQIHEEQNTKSNEYLEARDRRTFVKYEFKDGRFQFEGEKQKLNQWLGEMHFKVVSASFNLYLSGELTFQEVKVHCCENLLLNLLNFLETLTYNGQNSLYSSRIKQPLQFLEMTNLLKHINQVLNKNLDYMQIKYPLTKDSKPNKALQSLITKINNLGNDEHDLIMKSRVSFQLKQEGNYTSNIMKLINFLIAKQTELCGVRGNNKKQLTYFEYFYETMEKIFTSVYKPDFNAKQKEKDQAEEALNLFAQIMTKAAENEGGQSKQQKEYKQKVMKYTHYLIGQKISSNCELYSEKDMQTQIFQVKNSSILRILTKWTEELERKIMDSENEILKRPFRFKRNRQSQFSKLNANQKNDLYQETKRRSNQVKAFNEQLQENYNQIQAMLSSHLKQDEQNMHIPKNEYKVGFFCQKIQAAASSTLLSYLNKIIHILLVIPEQLKKLHMHDEQYIENMDINLITFKISDLFRCKIKSRQSQIIRIFKEIKAIHQKGEPFKIVRIKDRLNQGTRDIMVNIIFKGIFLCEIQLAIQQYVQNKQQSYDSFSHFLYEMRRSRLGPIMESACTWSQFDQRVKIFKTINQNIIAKPINLNVSHNCNQQFFIVNQYPFVCTICEKFYSNYTGLINHKKCVLCKAYYQCSVCLYNKMSEAEISNLLGLKEILGLFKDQFRLWTFDQTSQKYRKFPVFGLITSKKMKKPEIIFFQTIVFKYDTYIIQIKVNQKEQQMTQLIIIEKIQGNSLKKIHEIAQKYIIYEWKQERNNNTRIMPQNMKKMLEQQKRQRQLVVKQKKQQKEKKKLQLEKKRKQQEEKVAKFLKRGDEQKKQKKKTQSEDNSSQEQKQKTEQNVKKLNYNYNENLFKRNGFLEVRVVQRQIDGITQTLVLGVFLKEYTIRNKLKKMNNKYILQKLANQKIEVLFMQDEFIHDEINLLDELTQTQVQELNQTFDGINQVYFDNNFINQITFVKGINNLKVAHFSHNKIRDMSPFENLTQLTQLVLENNQIEYFDGLLKYEYALNQIDRNLVSQLSFFTEIEEGEFKKLKNLYINDNRLSSMEGVEKLTNLVKLDLSFNQIEQIAPINTFLLLQQLDLSSNKITKMKGIGNFVNLKRLYLNHNNIKIISKEVAAFQQLSILNLSSNKIIKIQNLNKGNMAKTLKILNLNHNKISKMQGLDGLEALEQFYIRDNEIQSIDSYLDLVNLNTLDLSFNSIQEIDIEDLEKDLPCLKKLDLSANIINNSESNKKNLEALKKLFGNINVMFKKQL